MTGDLVNESLEIWLDFIYHLAGVTAHLKSTISSVSQFFVFDEVKLKSLHQIHVKIEAVQPYFDQCQEPGLHKEPQRRFLTLALAIHI